MQSKPEIDQFKSLLGSAPKITEDVIKNLVHTFYSKVRQDPIIGPIFEEKLGGDWDNHLDQLCNFWASIALISKKYDGQPMLKHVNLIQLEKDHFGRWLAIFEENAKETCPEDVATFFIGKARKIAESLMQGIDFYRNEKMNDDI